MLEEFVPDKTEKNVETKGRLPKSLHKKLHNATSSDSSTASPTRGKNTSMPITAKNMLFMRDTTN